MVVIALGGLFFLPWREYLAIREIAVQGGERIPAERVLQRLPFQVGANWVTADTAAAERALLELPELQYAQIARVFWGRIRVSLQERQPLAVVRLQEGFLYWVDSEGFLMAPAQDALYGPVFSGLETVQSERGLRLADPYYAIPIRALMARPGYLLAKITAVRFERSDLIMSMRDGPEIWLASYDLHSDLVRLEQLIAALPQAQNRAIDLRWRGLVIVRDQWARTQN